MNNAFPPTAALLQESDIPAWTEAGKAGFKICCHCGLPKIRSYSADGVVRCDDCKNAIGEDVYCRKCAEQIDLDRRNWFKRKGYTPPRVCTFCTPSAKFPRKACLQCGLFHSLARPFMTDHGTCSYAFLRPSVSPSQ